MLNYLVGVYCYRYLQYLCKPILGFSLGEKNESNLEMPALFPACVYPPNYRVSLEHRTVCMHANVASMVSGGAARQ